MVRRILIALVLVLLASGATVAWVWWHAQPKPMGNAYVGISDLALWDGTGPVRRRLAQLPYGQSVVILDRYNDSDEIRTANGGVGWVNQSDLIEPSTWQQLGDLALRVRTMPVEAEGHTRVLSNVRLDPGRTSARVGQLSGNTPVQILGRSVAARNGNGETAEEASGRPRMEDWLLIRARTQQMGEIAGWVLGDFIKEDPPGPVAAEIASAGMRPIAWFQLRKIIDPTRGPTPYYLVAGTMGPEGQTCDFTMLRVYTWSIPHQHYETAFVQNGLCGRLPVEVTFAPGREQEVYFRFQDVEPAGTSTLTYRMQNTIVKALQSEDLERPKPPRRRGG